MRKNEQHTTKSSTITPYQQHLVDRVKSELMFPLDDFSEIITNSLIRHLLELGVCNWQIKKLSTTGMVVPTAPVVSKLELLVRLFQFKVGIHTQEILDEFLEENIGFEEGHVAIFPSEKYKFNPYEIFGYCE